MALDHTIVVRLELLDKEMMVVTVYQEMVTHPVVVAVQVQLVAML